MTHNLLGISGSLRQSASNRMLIREAARLYDDTAFTEADLDLPLYDGDVETSSGIPAKVQQLTDQIATADAIVIATPEYNKSLSGVLKNALDWVSRVEGNPWENKPVAIMSSAAGRTGGEAAQFALRLAMVSFRARLLQGPQVMIAGGVREFDDAGRLTSDRYSATLGQLMQALRASVTEAV